MRKKKHGHTESETAFNISIDSEINSSRKKRKIENSIEKPTSNVNLNFNKTV